MWTDGFRVVICARLLLLCGERERGREEGGRKGRRERERGRERGKEGGREGRREGVREGERERKGEREGGREKGREGGCYIKCIKRVSNVMQNLTWYIIIAPHYITQHIILYTLWVKRR